jgi:N-methylhydantoinase B/oxoprolinase/acetone carboxylase alpha subunit
MNRLVVALKNEKKYFGVSKHSTKQMASFNEEEATDFVNTLFKSGDKLVLRDEHGNIHIIAMSEIAVYSFIANAEESILGGSDAG